MAIEQNRIGALNPPQNPDRPYTPRLHPNCTISCSMTSWIESPALDEASL
jgi:hypothetical protein